MKIKNCTVFLLIAAPLLSGCVVNQTLPYAYAPLQETAKINGTVGLSVKDERSFIVNGDKEPSYVGHFRGGYGNTWDVKTEGKIALAEQFRGDLQKELESLGASKGDAGSPKNLKVTILDYNFDSYINGRFWYKIKVEVYGPQNNLLAEDTVEEETTIKGSFWVGPVFAFKKQTPVLHAKIIRSLVRENGKILNALQP